MSLAIPLPTADVADDPSQYAPLLISSIGEFLQSRSIWAEDDYDEAYSYMEDLKQYVLEIFSNVAALVPVGTIAMWATATAPAGWLLCQGQAISRTDYNKLFAAWGTAYGIGNGTTTFNVPDMRERSPFGANSTFPLADKSGALTVTLDTTQIPAHNHGITDPGHTHGLATGFNFIETAGAGLGVNRTSGAQIAISSVSATASANTGISANNQGGGLAHSNLHPIINIHFIAFAGQ